MAGKIKTVDGAALTADKFAYVGDPSDPETWHLPLDTKQHVNSALDMFAHTDLPSSAKGPTARTIAAKARDMGLDTTDFVKNHLSASNHAEPTGSGWIEIFRAGDYGEKGTFTGEDLDRIADSYNPDFHEAPVVIGHPKDNAPAYAWIGAVKREGDKLLAQERQVDPQFHDARSAGRYKKRSASFYTDEKGKPTYLRHVGWLGAQPPAVKGLRDIKFSDEGRRFTEVDFQEETVPDNKSVADQVKEYLAGIFSGNSAKSFSEDDAKRIAAEAVAAAIAPHQAKIADLEGKLTKQATEFAERERKIAGGETQLRANEAIARLKGAGKWIPAFDKQGVPLIFAELAKLQATVEFGEGAEKKQTSLFDLAVNFFDQLPAIVPAGRVVGVASPGKPGAVTGDPLTDAAKARQKEKNISFSDALDQVIAEKPHLVRPGGQAGGQV